MEIDRKLIEELARFMDNQPEIVAAYLYGSYASNKLTPMSDLDLAILLDNSISPDKYFDYRFNFGLDDEFPCLNLDIDVVILNQTPPLLTYEILKKGKLLFCKDKARRVFFTARAIRKYLDTKHLRKIQFLAVEDRIKGGQYGHLKGSDLFTIEKIRNLSAKIAKNREDKEE